MSDPWISILVLFILILANGVFAMAEISLVSVRKARLQTLADEGSRKAARALKLAEDPTRFLSTVQVGITLIGTLSGAFGGALLAEPLEEWLKQFEAVAPLAGLLSLIIVVFSIAYASLILGELVPKRLGLVNPESKAMLLAGPMQSLARLASPLVWLLSASTGAVLKLLGADRHIDAPPSEEEIHSLIDAGTAAGVFHRAERAMVEGVLDLDDTDVREIMTHRNSIVWLDLEESDEVNWQRIVQSGHSHFPAFKGTRDQVVGLISVKELWAGTVRGQRPSLETLAAKTKPLMVPETVSAVQLLETFKKSGCHIALVVDEFGGIEGLITLIDVMEAIVGDLPEAGDPPDPGAVMREDGSWLVDGSYALDDLVGKIPGWPEPEEDDANFHTLGGLVMDRMGRMPVAGDKFEERGWRIEVMDMDRTRVDKVLLQQTNAQAKEEFPD